MTVQIYVPKGRENGLKGVGMFTRIGCKNLIVYKSKTDWYILFHIKVVSFLNIKLITAVLLEYDNEPSKKASL